MNTNTSNNNDSVNHLQKAEAYLTSIGIAFTDDHILHMQRYEDFLYMKDKAYTKVNRSELTSRPDHNGLGGLDYTTNKDDKKLSNIHLIALYSIISIMMTEQIDLTVEEDNDTSEAQKQANTNAINSLRKHYKKYNLWGRLEQCLTDVLGVGAVGIFIDYNNRLTIRHTIYNGTSILPLKIVDDTIVDVAFVGHDPIDDKKTILTICTKNVDIKTESNSEVGKGGNPQKPIDNGYTVVVMSLGEGDPVMLEKPTILPIRPFVILKPYLNTKNTNYTNAFGYPIYWNFRDYIERIDNLVDAHYTEVEMAKRQFFISDKLLPKDESGNYVIPPEWKRGFVVMSDENHNSAMGEGLIKEFAPTPILDKYSAEIECLKKEFSVAIGLGSDSLSMNKRLAPTATQIISENTEKYATAQKHYNQMATEFIVLNKAILYYISTYGLDKDVTDYNIDVMYSHVDNVIEDKGTITDRANSKVDRGVMSVYRHLKEVEQLSGDDLTQELARLGYDENGM